jgi:Nitronate monooxygenase
MLSFGDPGPFAGAVRQAGAVLIIQVTDLEEARQAADLGADVIVAQGTEAGGHGARHGRSTLPFVPVVVDLQLAVLPDLDQVPGRAGLESSARDRAQGAPQSHDVARQRRRRARRRRAIPDLISQLISGDDAIGPEQQRREQRSLAGGPHGGRRSRGGHQHRSEQSESNLGGRIAVHFSAPQRHVRPRPPVPPVPRCRRVPGPA